MHSVALTRVRVKFGRPKLPSIHEILDYLLGITLNATPIDIVLRVIRDDAPLFPDWVNLTFAAGWAIMSWMRCKLNERTVVSGKLPPLEGRIERFIPGAALGIILAIVLYKYSIWWAWYAILLSWFEKKLPPPKQSA